ncbi:ATP-binding protein [Pseudomonas sp. TE3610]
MKSIRQRTLWLILSLLVVGMLVLGLLNWHDSNHEIAEIYDAQLAQNARLLKGVMNMPVQQHEPLWEAFNRVLNTASPQVDGHPYESKMAFQVWNRDGTVLVHTASAPGQPTPPAQPGFGYVTDTHDKQWRSFVLLDPTTGLSIWVGERHDVRSDLVNRILRNTLLPNLLGALVLALLVWLAIGWGLKPLADLAATLRARDPDSLEPLHLTPLPVELEPMQSALNRLLSQVQAVLGRERRFIADAAHEMRTPLAVMRVHAQNLQQPSTEAEHVQSLHNLITGVDRTSRLVNQLLTMARLEPHVALPALAPLDLHALLQDMLAQLAPWLMNQGLDISLEGEDSPLLVLGERSSIEIAINNLITNAATFSPPAGVISVQLQSSGATVAIHVLDQGPGIEEANRARLFERFYSQGNAQGAGLGLTIVQTIAQRLGGEVTLYNRSEGGLNATLKLQRY